ncbi:HEAT repeat domain-containing protein [Paenibacillus sp. SYP-B4298]|uniref:HEAT repeat domain-containing protein n=1 Tax=Paenibacillus sp. SYP-B4298 TaxID=2996034 RepID=UPI0022DDEC34|nr:HEAT repeat domain-containing protein [Paenibacillus sp. SYP-B4298]
MKKNERLDRLIIEGKIEEAIKTIQFIGDTKDGSYMNTLIMHLKSTENNKLRNDIALALSDLGDRIAVEPLIEVLVHPKTKGSRGTLLYALENLDYRSHIETITGFIGEDTLEASMQSLLLLENIVDCLSDLEKERCRNIIKPKLKSNNEMLEEALELLK